jgi:hypothetical protein
MRLSDLKAQVAALQERMGLTEWKLTVKWAEVPADIPDDGDAAIVVGSIHEGLATIDFKKPKRGEPVSDSVIAHELAHLYFAPFYIPPNDLNEERACWSIAHAVTG